VLFRSKDYKAASEFFCSFSGVEINDKDPLEVFVYWGITVKSILLFSMIYLYSTPLINEENLTDLMVDLSLKIWGYQKEA
jgi:hypothetical protein